VTTLAAYFLANRSLRYPSSLGRNAWRSKKIKDRVKGIKPSRLLFLIDFAIVRVTAHITTQREPVLIASREKRGYAAAISFDAIASLSRDKQAVLAARANNRSPRASSNEN